MELQNKGFMLMMLCVLLGGIGYAYWHFVIDRDYTLVHDVDCDPTAQVCYYWQCDPAAIEEDEKCTGDPDEDEWYYTRLERVAKNVPLCSVDDETCDAFACADEEEGCGEVLCNAEIAEQEGVLCSDPEEYIAAHPEALLEEEDESTADDGEEEIMEEENVEEADVSADMNVDEEDTISEDGVTEEDAQETDSIQTETPVTQ